MVTGVTGAKKCNYMFDFLYIRVVRKRETKKFYAKKKTFADKSKYTCKVRISEKGRPEKHSPIIRDVFFSISKHNPSKKSYHFSSCLFFHVSYNVQRCVCFRGRTQRLLPCQPLFALGREDRGAYDIRIN